jgi:tetratricopeptide (TPR) repeat protein
VRDKLRDARAAVTLARGFLERGRIEEAEEAASRAVGALEGEEAHAVLIEALTLLGTARARSLQTERARESFRRASSLADKAGDNESAGRAAISYIEELSGQMSTGEACDVYLYADRLLAGSRHKETLARLRRCALAVISAVRKGGEV